MHQGSYLPVLCRMTNAPPSWRCIDFISDIHLDPSLPATTACLARYLRTTPADAVFVLGDLFEAWIGDDARFAAYESQCADTGRRGSALASESWSATAIFCRRRPDCCLSCTGPARPNRATSLGSDLLVDARRRTLPLPTYPTCNSDRRFASRHGKNAFCHSLLAQRQLAASQMRQASQMHQKAQAQQDWADVDEPTAADWMTASKAQHLIHGHTHRPKTEPLGQAGAMY